MCTGGYIKRANKNNSIFVRNIFSVNYREFYSTIFWWHDLIRLIAGLFKYLLQVWMVWSRNLLDKRTLLVIIISITSFYNYSRLRIIITLTMNCSNKKWQRNGKSAFSNIWQRRLIVKKKTRKPHSNYLSC